MLDKKVIDGLASVIADLNGPQTAAIPVEIVETLSELAQPGLRLKIDIAASRPIGVPLVTLTQSQSDLVLSSLTPRQKEVAKLMIQGRSNKEIAALLKISVATVKDHAHAILDRLNLPSRIALIAKAQGVEAI